jgi:uncharacterized YccA/Bax inhibitor family protein
MRTANPSFRTGAFADFREGLGSVARDRKRADTMTVQGTVNRTGFLLVLAFASAAWTWSIFFRTGNPAAVAPWMWGGMIAGLVFALVTIFWQKGAPFTAPLYALAEGLFLGGISAFVEQYYPGVPLMAVGLTFGTLGVLLLGYTTRVLRATPAFVRGIVMATGAIFLVYLASWILGMFGVAIPYIHGNGLIGIGFSLAVVVIAALNLVLDFHFIEEASESGAPKYLEWYGAFGLMVTLVWLYIELLHLLMKLQSRR